MDITPQRIASLISHKDRYKSAVDKIASIIDGSYASVTDLIGADTAAAVKVAERFADDVLVAYNIYPAALFSYEYDMSYDEYFEMFLGGFDKKKGEPSRLDADQRTLVKSMLCCLVLLGAHGPGFDPTASIASLKENCGALLTLFKRDGSHKGMWQQAVQEYAFAHGKPKMYGIRRLTGAVLNSPGMVFPSLWDEDIDSRFEILADDLNSVYETLSGKHLASIITNKDRNAYMANTEYFAGLKNPMAIEWLNQEELDVALKHGWVTEDDIPSSRPFGGIEPPDPEEDLWGLAGKFTPEDFNRECERIQAWAEELPWKEAWCKHYQRMYRALFKLDGIKPLSDEPDPLHHEDASPIAIDQLLGAIDAVLDAWGLAHYDDVFKAAYAGVQRTHVQVLRVIKQRG